MSEREEALRILAVLGAGVAMGKVEPSAVIERVRPLLGAAALALGSGEQSSMDLVAPVVAQPSKRKRAAGVAETAVVVRLFEHWRVATGHEAARLTPERARLIKARLVDGYTEAEIKAAIEGCAASPFHTGDNDRGTRYDDITLICRNGSKLESFMERAGGAPPIVAQADQARATKVSGLREQLEDARREGDRDRYEKINRQLAAALRADAS